MHSTEDQSVFMIPGADLSHIFGCDLEQNQAWVIIKEKSPDYHQFSSNIIRIHSQMSYSDLIDIYYSKGYKN